MPANDDKEQQRPLLLFRKLIGWLLLAMTLGGFFGMFARPPDAYPSVAFVASVHADWIGCIAALVSFGLGGVLWLSKTFRVKQSKPPLMSQAITGVLVVGVLNGLTFFVATTSAEQWIARYDANVDTRYLTAVTPFYEKNCSHGVEWYDPTVGDSVRFCTNLAIFGRNDHRRFRSAIAHVLRGPSGIRVVTIRALDTELGQQDLAIMRAAASAAGKPSSPPQ